MHGTTVHGRQAIDRPTGSGIPGSYYARPGPIGDVFRLWDDPTGGPDRRRGPRRRRARASTHARGRPRVLRDRSARRARRRRDPALFTYLSDRAARPRRRHRRRPLLLVASAPHRQHRPPDHGRLLVGRAPGAPAHRSRPSRTPTARSRDDGMLARPRVESLLRPRRRRSHGGACEALGLHGHSSARTCRRDAERERGAALSQLGRRDAGPGRSLDGTPRAQAGRDPPIADEPLTGRLPGPRSAASAR